MKDAREKSRILSIIIFILSLIVMSINGCNSGGYEDNFIEDKKDVVKKNNAIKKSENDIAQYQYEYDNLKTRLSDIDNHLENCPDSTKMLLKDFLKPMFSESYTRLGDLKHSINEEEESIVKKEGEIVYLSSEKRVKDNQFNIAWHDAWIDFNLKYILIPCLLVFILSFFRFENINGNLREKAIENPSNIFIVTKSNGKYQVVFRRWWYTITDKSFNSQAEAIVYTDALENERMEKNWHKIK